MKPKTVLIALIGVFILNALLFQNCKKEDEPNKAPSCEITNPSDGEECTQDEIVTISVVASDSDGSITEVRFTIDGVSKGTVNSSPYNYDWNTNGESIGNRILKATSIDNGGASTSDEITIELIKGKGSAFTASPIKGNAPLTVDFTDQSTNDPISWHWDFGDGNSSTDQNPLYVYNSMGMYDVSLTATNADGSDTKTKANFINVTGVFTDTRDGQTYNIVTIDTQTWFAENLNYETANSWWYFDDVANGDIYGRLYSFNDAMTACPGGWHLASDKEWKSLEIFMGMSQSYADGEDMRGTDEGKKLKSISGWNTNDGTDEVGFTALPGGELSSFGFLYIGDFAIWWTSTEYFEQDWKAWYRFMGGGEDRVGRDKGKKEDVGYYVRCIKN